MQTGKERGHFTDENQRRRERHYEHKLRVIEELVSESLSAEEIGDHMNWSQRTLRRWLQRHDPAHPSLWMRVTSRGRK